jgi:uncharacterized membrane protein YcaP (DUF421 family)
MENIWSNMFVLGLPLAEKILRPIVVYAFLVVGLRLAGKHQLAQLNPFDLVVLLTLSNTVQNAIIGNDNSVSGGILGAATLLLVNYIVVRFLFNHPKLELLIEGKTDVLIEDGKIREDRLKKELLTLDELETAAHRQGFASLKDVQRAVIETGGTIYFLRKEPPKDEIKHAQVMARLDALSQQLKEIRQKM